MVDVREAGEFSDAEVLRFSHGADCGSCVGLGLVHDATLTPKTQYSQELSKEWCVRSLDKGQSGLAAGAKHQRRRIMKQLARSGWEGRLNDPRWE